MYMKSLNDFMYWDSLLRQIHIRLYKRQGLEYEIMLEIFREHKIIIHYILNENIYVR